MDRDIDNQPICKVEISLIVRNLRVLFDSKSVLLNRIVHPDLAVFSIHLVLETAILDFVGDCAGLGSSALTILCSHSFDEKNNDFLLLLAKHLGHSVLIIHLNACVLGDLRAYPPVHGCCHSRTKTTSSQAYAFAKGEDVLLNNLFVPVQLDEPLDLYPSQIT